MPITEIASRNDARDRLRKIFLPPEDKDYSEKQRSLANHIEIYADLAFFLSSRDFEVDVADASESIWIAYNDPSLILSANRYTNAIAAVGRRWGLSGNASYVLTNEANQLFGELLKGGHLWKDSFAPGHGEFAHSYQWLAFAISRQRNIFQLYSGTQVLSYLPLFVKGNPAIEVRRAFLWEWLVDCTRYRPGFDDQISSATANYIQSQQQAKRQDVWHQNISPHEITNFLRDEYPELTVFSTKYRNANTVTDLVKSRNGWFIAEYENRSGFRARRREEAHKIDFSVSKLNLNPPTDEQRRQFEGLDLRQTARALGATGNAAKQLQPIDLGKVALQNHYQRQAMAGLGNLRVEKGKSVGFVRTSSDRLADKLQIRTAFHGIPGLLNATFE